MEGVWLPCRAISVSHSTYWAPSRGRAKIIESAFNESFSKESDVALRDQAFEGRRRFTNIRNADACGRHNPIRRPMARSGSPLSQLLH